MEKKEKAVFGIRILGKDWCKINVFQAFGDSGMWFCEKKRCDNPVFGRIMSDLGTFLGKEDSIIEFQCNVMLSGLEAGEYSSDFVCKKQNGDLMVRECVERRFLKKPMTVKLLDASREC